MVTSTACIRMSMTPNGHLMAHWLQPVQRCGSCRAAILSQRMRSSVSKCSSQAATHHPHPVQRWVSMSGRRPDLRGRCGDRAVPAGSEWSALSMGASVTEKEGLEGVKGTEIRLVATV